MCCRYSIHLDICPLDLWFLPSQEGTTHCYFAVFLKLPTVGPRSEIKFMFRIFISFVSFVCNIHSIFNLIFLALIFSVTTRLLLFCCFSQLCKSCSRGQDQMFLFWTEFCIASLSLKEQWTQFVLQSWKLSLQGVCRKGHVL